VRRGHELVDARRVDGVAREVGPPLLAHTVGQRLLGVRGVDHDEAPRPRVVRRRRETGGLDEVVEHRALDRVGAERADRTALLDEPGHAHRNRSSCGGRTSWRTEPVPNHDASSPRTIATGTLADLPITNSAADAISSAIATSVTISSRPSASEAPRRSTTAVIPHTPIATSLSPWRQGRPNVSDTITATSTPARACNASHTCFAERSASTGSNAA